MGGEESKKKADALAIEMRLAIGDTTRVGRPTRKIELRILGLDEETEQEEVRKSLIDKIGREEGEIKVGEIRRNKFGIGSVWVQCPWYGTSKLIRRDDILIGWVRARVVLVGGVCGRSTCSSSARHLTG